VSSGRLGQLDVTSSPSGNAADQNGFSKKIENHGHAVSLHFMHYNFCRKHQSLKGQTPAMAAGVADHVWSIAELVALLPERTGRFTRIGAAAE
jgi:hypothetical protein